jgi:hypothetical protein
MTLNLQTPFPTFGGSTGGWLRAAEVEEKYAITWTSNKEQIFEIPTGGAAITNYQYSLNGATLPDSSVPNGANPYMATELVKIMVLIFFLFATTHKFFAPCTFTSS